MIVPLSIACGAAGTPLRARPVKRTLHSASPDQQSKAPTDTTTRRDAVRGDPTRSRTAGGTAWTMPSMGYAVQPPHTSCEFRFSVLTYGKCSGSHPLRCPRRVRPLSQARGDQTDALIASTAIRPPGRSEATSHWPDSEAGPYSLAWCRQHHAPDPLHDRIPQPAEHGAARGGGSA